jgi:methylase of polypeptide subunit release factors
MSQRESGYERIERDCYETPEWVTRALLPHLGNINSVWEPAAGSGKMVRVLEAAGLQVFSTDISAGQDFLLAGEQSVDAIVTNPPYNSATPFIEHALRLMRGGGKVAMLLRTDFDHAKTRRHLFSDCPAFARKIVLTKRIRWIENSIGQPSFNHAWYIWDHKHAGKPTLEYDLQHQGSGGRVEAEQDRG